MNIFLMIIALLIIKNRDIFGKVFYENSFLLGSEGWIITGNKLESDALHQSYTLLQRDNNCNTQMSRYITGKDDLVNVDSKNKDDKNLWYFKSPPIKISHDKTSGKPVLLTFTLTSFMGDFRHLNRCSALIKIKLTNGNTFSYPYVTKYDGNMVSFNVPLRGDLWYNDAETKVNFDTIFDAEFEIEILGDWTRGVEVIGLDNVIIY
jgi:hypothetical protein